MVYPGFIEAGQAVSSDELDRIARINLPPTRYLSTSAGRRLAYYSFEPRGKARAILLLYHAAGRRVAMHYPILARRLVMDHGMAVYLMDARGQSRAQPGMDVRLKNTGGASGTRIWKNTRDMLRMLRRAHPGRRLYLAGHGRGAGMILNYSAWSAKHNPDGYVFLAPDLGRHGRFQASSTGSSCAVNLNNEDFNAAAPSLARSIHSVSLPRSGGIASAFVPRRPRAQFRGLNRPAALFMGARDELFKPGEIIAFARLIRTRKVARILPGSGHYSLLLETAGSIAAFVEGQS